MILCLLVTGLINPGSWWARYAPQIALIPVIMTLAVIISEDLWRKIAARAIFILIIINSALIIPANTRYFVETSRKIQNQIDQMIAKCGKGTYLISDTEGYHYEQFLHKNGIEVVYSQKPEDDIKKLYPQNELFPLESVFLYKKDCVSKEENN
ncbi:MAG: hypothetical protein WCJ33_00605, partial [Pseudomonadota bacterium]